MEAGNPLAETAVAVSKDAMVAVNKEGLITIFNPAAEAMFGCKRPEMIGQPLDEILPDDFRGMHRRFLTGYFAHGKPNSAIGKTVELQAMRRDGTRFPIELSLSAGQHRGEPFVIAVIRDITERKEAEVCQTELLNRLEAANQELRDFAYVASHDLKAPLRSIASLASWISADYAEKLDATGREHLALLTSRVTRMNNLIDGVLQYSRIGRVDETLARVDLNRIVTEVMIMLAPSDNVHFEIEETLPTVVCDPTRIEQVFQNLLHNAIQHSVKPEVRISVGYGEDADGWCFHVRDNGPGIDARHHARIFRMFQTLSPRDGNESTGIGLPMVKRILERCGGRVWLESAPGQGSTFHFTLPKDPGRPEDARDPVWMPPH